jgi:hypothetical protein
LTELSSHVYFSLPGIRLFEVTIYALFTGGWWS